MKRKNILFISNSANIGGAQNCLMDLIIKLPSNFHPIIIIPSKGNMELKLNDLKIQYIVIPFRGWWYSRFRVKLVERLFNNFFSIIILFFKLRKIKIDLVYTNTMYSPIGGLLSYLLRIPHIWHIHEFVHLNYIQKFDFGKYLSFKFIAKTSSIILCPSYVLKYDLSNYLDSNKIFVIHNGVAFNNFNILKKHELKSDKALRLILVGSIINFKGHKDAILLISKLKSLEIEVILNIVGEGDSIYIKSLKQLAIDLGVSNNINWLGFQNNVSQHISNSDILIVCSLYETFGMTILEAMNNYCPVIATNVGGIREIIINGFNGLLYDPSDINKLVNCVLSLYDNELYNHICTNGFLSIKNRFNVEVYSEAIITKIKCLIID